jgi:hypothetical protein
MEQIIKYLKDPAWWFTAVFIAVVSSLFAAYLKDAIQNLFAEVSTKYKLRLTKQRQLLDLEIKCMIEDHQYLTLSFLKAIIQVSGFVALFVTYNISSLLFIIYLKQSSTELLVKLVLGSIALSSACALIYASFQITPKIKAAKKAYSIYRKKVIKNCESTSTTNEINLSNSPDIISSHDI